MKILYTIRKVLFGSVLERDIKISTLQIKGSDVSKKYKVYANIMEWFSTKYTDLFIVPCETISRFLYWGWKLRYSYDFECGYGLYYMTYLKTGKLIEYSRKHSHLMWNSKEDGKEFRKLKIASEIAKRLYEDDYNTNLKNHRDKWGNDEFYFEPNPDNKNLSTMKHKLHLSMTESEIQKERQEFRRAIETDALQKDNEKKYLYKLLEKHAEGWWD